MEDEVKALNEEFPEAEPNHSLGRPMTTSGKMIMVSERDPRIFREYWSERIAQRLASRDGKTLDRRQLTLVTMARGYFIENKGKPPDMKTLYSFVVGMNASEARLLLFRLFHAPLTEICRYACIPVPKNA